MIVNFSRSVFFLLICCIIGIKSFGGVNTYVYSQSSTTYSPIIGGIAYSGSTSVLDVFPNIPIGFNYNFNGTNYTNFGVSNYGYLKLGATVPTDIYSNNYILQSGTLNDVIAAFNTELELGFITKGDYTANSDVITNVSSLVGVKIGDVVDPYGIFFPVGTTVLTINSNNNSIVVSSQSSASSTNEDVQFDNGEIRVQTIGTAPNRVCVVQWNHVHYIAEPNSDFNFQIKLYEGSNNTSIVYGPMFHNSYDNEVQVGLTGVSRSDFKIRKTATNWNATINGTFNNSTCSTSQTIIPAPGLSFNFAYCIAPTAPIISANANPSCVGSAAVLSLTGGSLNGSAQWAWRTGSCTGPVVNTGSTYNFTTPSSNTTLFVSGSGGCITIPTACTVFTLASAGVPNLSLLTTPANTTLCGGDALTLNASGAPSIVWSGGVQNNVSFLPNATTIYTVTGTLANGCTQSLTQLVTMNSLSNFVSINAVPSNATVCAGQSLTLTGSNFSTYVWSGNATNGQSFTPTVGGIYTVTGTSAVGNCTGTGTISVVVNAIPNVVCSIAPNATFICSNQSATLSATGANTYSWSGGITNNVQFQPTASAVYTVVGTDVNGCTNTCTKSLTVLTAPNVTASSIPASGAGCFGFSLTLNGNGASTYSWSNGATNGISSIATASNIYTVTGTASNACTATNTISITVNPTPTVTIATTPTNAIICAGGSAILTANGANTYTWSAGVLNGVVFTPSTSATYTVTGTSADGCTKTATKSLSVINAPVVTIATSPVNATICAGANVSLTATGISNIAWSGGIINGATFSPSVTTTYSVSGTNAQGCVGSASKTIIVNQLPSTAISATPNSATICFGSSMLLAGIGANTYTWSGGIANNVAFNPSASATYTVTGISTANCTKTASITVTLNPLPTITASSNAANNAICIGESVILNGNGGTSYTWSGGITNNASFTPTATATYSVTGTNANNCESTATITIVVNQLPVINISSTPSNGTICVGNAIVLNATAANTTINWSNGISNNTAFYPTSSSNYIVTATNNTTGCASSASSSITVNSLPIITTTASPSSGSICAGSSVSILASGANSYSWSNGISNGVNFSPNATNTYTVVGTNAQGCENTATAIILVNDGATISIAASPSNATICSGSPILLNATGNATYTWSHSIINNTSFIPASSATYTVTGTTSFGCTASSTFSVLVNSLPNISINSSPANATICVGNNITLTAGGANTYSWSGGITNGTSFSPSTSDIYTVTGTNSNGCVAQSSIPIIVNAVPIITINALPGAAQICFGGSISLTASGANTYSWSGGISNGISFSPNTSGIYTVIGTTASSCTGSATINVTVGGLPNVSATAIPANASICYGQSITLNGSGATNYVWSGNVINGQSFVPTNSAVYTVTGSSGVGCANTATIAINVYSLPILSVTILPSGNICAGDNISLGASGANTYTWSNGIINNGSFAINNSNVYSVTGTDGNGCTASNTVNVAVNALPTITINATPNQSIYCLNSSVTLNATGASTIAWSGNVVNGTPFGVLSSDVYTVTATSNAGCVNTATKSIDVSTVSASITSNPTSAVLCPNQSIILSGNGGATYTWSNGVTNGVAFTPNGANTYTLTSTDANGCTATSTILVSINTGANLSISTIPSNAQVCNGNMVQINATSNVNVAISGGQSNNTNFLPSGSTIYTITASNGSGCSTSGTVQFTILANPTVTASTTPSNGIVCANGTITLNAGGASSYAWSNNAVNGQSFILASSGVYTVTGTGSNGCTNSATVSASLITPSASIISNPAVASLCPNQSITLTGNGGSTYSWTGGVINGTAFTPNNTSSYTLTSTDANNCTATSSITVTINTGATLNIATTPASTLVCDGSTALISATSNVAITISGGISNNVAFSPNSSTIYTITASNGSSCSTSSTVQFSIIAKPVVTATSAPSSGLICVGGSATLSGGGASSYTWSNNATDGQPFLLQANGVYTVTGTATNGCTNTATKSLSIVPFATIAIATLPTVFPICTGTPLTLTASGNATSYTWNNGVVNGVSFNSTANTSYVVTATSTNGCISTSVAQVNISAKPGAITMNTLPTNAIICLNSGLLCVATSVGGTLSIAGLYNPAITYSASSLQYFYPQTNTTYTVTSTNAACSISVTFTALIKALPVIVINTSLTNSNVCNGQPVTLTASNSGSYVWSNSVSNGVPFVPTNSGTYTVTATGLNNCVSSATVAVNIVNYPTLSVVSSPATLPVCGGTPVTLTATGAQSYSWSGGITNGTPFLIYNTNTYTVSGTNANICTSTLTSTVAINTLPVVNISVSPSYTICAGNSVTLNATLAGSTVSWSGNVVNNVPFVPTANTIYTVTTTNASGCVSTSTVLFTINALPNVTISTIPSNGTICRGSSVSIQANGANTYLWQNNNSTANPITFAAVSYSNNTVYTVTGTNSNGCSAVTTTLIVVNVAPTYTNLPVAGNQVNVCAGNSVTIGTLVTGGTFASVPSYTNGVTFIPANTTVYTVTVTGTNGCTSTFVRTVSVIQYPIITTPSTKSVCQGLPVGLTTQAFGNSISWQWPNGNIIQSSTCNAIISANTIFTVTATATANCSVTATVNVTNVVPPVIVIATTPANNIVCAGQPVTINATGGTIQSWSPSITNNVAFIPTVSSIYSVAVTNGGLCTRTSSVAITVSNPSPITSNVSPSAINCNGAPIIINASTTNATLGLTGAGNPTIGTAFIPTATSTYTLTSTNANGCTDSKLETITVNSLPNLSINSSVVNPQICVGSTVTITASGANSYTWLNNNSTVASLSITPTISTIYTVVGTSIDGCTSSATYSLDVQNYPTLSVVTTPSGGAICPGLPIAINATSNQSISISGNILNNTNFIPTVNTTYTISASNAIGCSVSTIQSITLLPALTTISLVASPSQQVCNGKSYTVTASGAVSYTWFNNATTANFQTAVMSSNINYAVTGTNASGCTKSTNIWMYAQAVPLGIYSINPASGLVCAGQQLKLVGTGGGVYTWTSGVQNNVFFTPSASGSYTCTATNSNGCTKTSVASITVSAPGAITINNSPANNTVCSGQSITVNGSSAGGTLSINGPSYPGSGSTFIPVASAVYTVTSVNSNSCTISTTFSVVVNPLPNLIVSASNTSSICPGENVNLNASGASSYVWTNNNATTATISVSPNITTTYTVTGTDNNNCSSSANTNVIVVPLPILSVTTIPANGSSCPNVPVSINATAGNGNTITITGGVTLGTPYTLLNTTTYTITATNSIGCSVSTTLTMFVNPIPILTITNFPNVSSYCENKTLTLTAAGADTYAWSGNISNGVSFLTTVSTVYTVTGTTNNGCSNSATRSVIVIPLPSIAIVTDKANNTVCFGSPIKITASGAINYSWSPNIVNNVSFIPVNSGTYTVLATNANGCTNTGTIAIVVSRPNAITITRNPIASFLCQGRSVTWNAVCVGNTSLVMTGPFGAALGVLNFPQASSYYTVTATNNLGCTRTQLAYLTIYQTPVLSVTTTPANGQVCAGQSMVLSGNGAYGYSWTGPGIAVITNNIPFTPPNTAIYTVVGTGANSCTAATITTVTVNPLPVMTILASATSVTSGTPVNLCGSGANTISWSGSVLNCTDFSPTVTSTYTVTGVNGFGCMGTKSITVTILPEPARIISNNGIINFKASHMIHHNLIECSIENNADLQFITLFRGKSKAELTEIVKTNGSPNNEYSLQDNDIDNSNYYYQIKATFKNTKVESEIIYLPQLSNVSLYPNPVVGDALNVNIAVIKDIDATIKITSINGSVVRIINTNLSKGDNVINVDASKLLQGNYILQVIANNKEIGNAKFSKQ